MSTFSGHLHHGWKCRYLTKNVQTILELQFVTLRFLVQVDMPQVKQNLVYSVRSLEAYAQSLFQNLNFGNSTHQKHTKNIYQIFLIVSIFTRFLYFAPNIFPGIVQPR